MIAIINQLAKKCIEKHPFVHPLVRWYFELKIDRSPLRKANDPVLVYRHDLSGISTLVQRDTEEHGAPLPDCIVIQPARYHFRGGNYDCLTPGVYRFIAPQHRNQQHVVLDRKDPVQSALLLSFLSIRGNHDDQRLIKDLEKIAVNRFLVLTCGQNCHLCQMILQKHGINSRIVYSHTYEAINSYNNGHVLLEVFSPCQKKYVLVDIDKKCSFLKNKNTLSLFEYSQALYKKESVDIKFYSSVSMLDLSGFLEKSTHFNYGFIEYSFYCSQDNLKACLSRVCGAPIMIDNNTTFVCAWDDEIKAKLQKINSSWKILWASEFVERFYSKK